MTISYRERMTRFVALLLSLVGVGACGRNGKSSADAVFTAGSDAVVNVPGAPGLGAHGLSFFRYDVNSPTTISSPVMSTQPANSTMIESIGRGNFSAHALPTDTKGNTPYQRLDTEHTYSRWATSGTGAYAFPNLAGGNGHQVTASTPSDDEITLAAVEVVNAGTVHQVVWSEVLAAPLTSRSVTTTGPATLVAFWWGDAGVDMNKTATPNNGFVLIDAILMSGALVQCAVAVKNVSAAGTYDVTWTATPAQGAQLWLIAVQ